jgi:acyl CoA:acetate/3-ketoacid CoA transferase alpha subunit
MTIGDLRKALRITVTDYDDELTALAEAGLQDLAMAGITGTDDLGSLDAVTAQAVKTYVRLHFGRPEDYERLERSYSIQKAQLKTATGHTDWGDLA